MGDFRVVCAWYVSPLHAYGERGEIEAFNADELMPRVLYPLHIHDCAEKEGLEGQASGEEEPSRDSMREY